MIFSSLPVRVLEIRELVWPELESDRLNLERPDHNESIDDVPIFAEQLITGKYFVHEGRFQIVRAIARGERFIKAHVVARTDAMTDLANVLQRTQKDLAKEYKPAVNSDWQSVKVRIVETGESFDSLSDCARAIGGNGSAISACVRGLRGSHKGYHFELVKEVMSGG